MAQQIKEDRYLVIEHDRITRKAKPPRLVSNLAPFRKRIAPMATEEEFVKDCVDGVTKRYGLEVRVASSDDIEKHGGDAGITAASDSYNGADERAKREKLEAARKIVPFFDGRVKTDEDLETTLNTYGISTTQLMAMAKSVRPEGIDTGEEFIKTYCNFVSARAKKAGNSRTPAEVRKDWNTLPKATKAAAN